MAGKDPVCADIDIDAPAEKVFAMVTDLPRMGEWSPDNRGGAWVGGATEAAPGVRFKGRNQNGKKNWSGVVRIDDVTPSTRFSFTTIVGPMQVGTWSYEIQATATGCNVVESWVDKRNVVFSLPALGRLVTGVGDRATHNKAAMEATLTTLKKAAESGA